jgi:major membrane immunogen (membrane-anchored lipoprotein)
MKKPLALFPIVLLFTLIDSTSTSSGQDIKLPVKSFNDSSITYKDGTYSGKSRAKYIYEPFWGIVHFTLKNGRFTDIRFIIRDSSLHETFNENYEKHFTGNDEYIQQSRNDWKGVRAYPKKLEGKSDTDKIDAISGATWSYNIFRASLKEALKNAK